MTGGTHSIRFPGSTEPIQHNELLKPRKARKPNGVQHTEPTVQNQVQLAPKPNVLNALDNARVQANTIFGLLNPIIGSDTRHGDLCAIRSAAKNLITNVDVLIQAEEES